VRQHLQIGGILAAVLGAPCSSQSMASTIVAPVTAETTSEFASNYSIINTINQSGLSLTYISGVTDFDTYLATKPNHTSKANGNEWFSQDFSKANPSLSSQNVGQDRKSGNASQKLGVGKVTNSFSYKGNQKVSAFGSASGKHSAGKVGQKKSNRPTQASTNSVSSSVSAISSAPLVSITYGFSELVSINGFVLWNDEFAGIGKTELLSSIDGITYTLLSTITPEPSKFAPTGQVIPYLAQVFSFDLTSMLFFKLLIYDCPGPPRFASNYRGCGIGEVAFSAELGPVDNNPVVPLPAALPLFASALGLFVWMGRRRKGYN